MNILLSQLKLIVYIIAYAIFSWILIHVLTVFGVFLAIAYPIWWFFAPKQTVCLFCRSHKEGEMCVFCRIPVVKNEGNAPKNLISAILNSSIILAFSLVSIGIIFAESQLLHALGFPPPSKTVFFTTSSAGEYKMGEIFPLEINITGITTPINTVRTDLRFDPHSIEVVDISTKDSFATIFIRKDIDNKGGFARLSGGIPNPGYTSDQGLFATFFLRGLKVGITSVKFLPTSVVLANNGRGENVLKNTGSVSYLILPQNVVKTDKTSQNKNVNLKVLGTSTSSADTQMIFYDESQVLGASTIPDIQEHRTVDVFGVALATLENVDRSILALWGKIF